MIFEVIGYVTPKTVLDESSVKSCSPSKKLVTKII